MVVRDLASGELGSGRQPGPSAQELLDQERRPVPVSLRSVSSVEMGDEDIPKERYTSAEFHRLEVERVWKRAWQMACREEDIPEVGDTVVYDVADLSFLIVRSAHDTIKAFPNACLHRGAQLRTADGNVPELRCPFHGFCWDLDGWLKDVPCAWDFPHVTAEGFNLPQVQVGTWEGFVFINPDPYAAPLDEYLGEVKTHVADIAHPALKHRYKGLHVAKIVRSNWKVGMEAFLESFHAITTHPQALEWTADSNSQYDTFEGQRHWNRMIVPTAVASPNLKYPVAEQDIADSLVNVLFGAIGLSELDVPEGTTAREVVGDTLREYLGTGMGVDASGLTDCQVIDTLGYFVFPNMVPFISLVQSLCFRFRPYGNDPDMSIMEVMLLFPMPEGGDRPPTEPIVWLGPDEEWASVELGMFDVFAPFLDQDVANMVRVQKGMKASFKSGMTLAHYQESRVRHFHQVLGEYVAE